MDLYCQLLLYFDKGGFLLNMKPACQHFLEDQNEGKTVRNFSPFRFVLEIDVMNLLETCPMLGDFLIKEPLKFQKVSSEILFACLKSLDNEANETVEFAQVAVHLRLKSIPRLLVKPNPHSYNGLIAFQGLVLTVSKPTNYVYHTVWSCPEECEDNEVILQCIPKVPPKCYICRSVLFENGGLRRCCEQITATFALENNFLSKTFVVIDDLVPKLRIGMVYNVSAILIKKTTAIWSIDEVVTLPAPLTTPIPSDIDKLYKACKGLPWQFIYCLASSIGVSVCPLNCFMHLKIGLLLSLTSVKANVQTGSTIVHVLAAGYDTSYVRRLMEEGAKLSDRSVFLGTTNTSASTTLIGSSGGICCMPLPLHSYSQKHSNCILSSIETGEVLTEVGKVKLKSAVWAQGMDFKKMILINVASVFGTVCRGDYGEYNDEIVDFVLQNAIEPTETSKEEIDALQDIRLYMDIVASICVSLDKCTESLLRNYFLAARKEGPRGVTIGSMSALVATCITSARLCRRSIANIDDAVFAIWLHVSGSPEPKFAPEEYLQTPADMKMLKKMMDNFKVWLEQFTGSYNS